MKIKGLVSAATCKKAVKGVEGEERVVGEKIPSLFQEIFGTESAYFVRNGLITIDGNNNIQLTFNGRLLPSKTPKEIQLNNLALPKNFITPAPSKAVPGYIQSRQKLLFGE